MAEAINFLRGWSSLYPIDLQIVQICAAASREKEAGRMALELPML
jgi:hypothetical protein